MWSEKKYINTIMNTLLFLLGINVFHYGQLLLPIMCLILYIDKGLKFKVSNIKVFTILCLFAISFCAFSYKLGFYCVMGFCLPMAYYIGSNMNEYSEENIKKVIYIITFGMVAHLVLNFLYDYSILGSGLMRSNKHYDFWTRAYMRTNPTSVLSLLIIACFYYLALYENNKKLKVLGVISTIFVLIYDLSLGRRTPIFMFAIMLGVSVFFDLFIYKNNKNKLLPILLVGIPFVLLIIIVIFYFTNTFGMQEYLDGFRFVIKIKIKLFDLDRPKIVLKALKQMPYHLWGGQEISTIIDSQIHELWLDIYDYAGIIPYVLMILYSISYIDSYIKKIKFINDKSFRLLLVDILICTVLLMFIEPVMTGSSLYLICIVLIGTTISLLKYEK